MDFHGRHGLGMMRPVINGVWAVMCKDPWFATDCNFSAKIWASCARNMPGRTDSSQESGRATAPPSSAPIPDLPRYSGASSGVQYSVFPSTSGSSPAPPRYTPNYSNLSLFAKSKAEDKAQDDLGLHLLNKHKQDAVTDSLLSFLQKKTDEECAVSKEPSGKKRRKENAMSHYPEDPKRLPGYDYHQWDYRGDAPARRGHLPFSQGWGSMAMANPYFTNPHMVPAHAHSTPDYRFNQWAASSKLAHAHSHPTKAASHKSSDPPLLDPLNDLQALVGSRDQLELVDLRLPGPASGSPEKPVQLTVSRVDPDKEISSTNDNYHKKMIESPPKIPANLSLRPFTNGETTLSKVIPPPVPLAMQPSATTNEQARQVRNEACEKRPAMEAPAAQPTVAVTSPATFSSPAKESAATEQRREDSPPTSSSPLCSSVDTSKADATNSSVDITNSPIRSNEPSASSSPPKLEEEPPIVETTSINKSLSSPPSGKSPKDSAQAPNPSVLPSSSPKLKDTDVVTETEASMDVNSVTQSAPEPEKVAAAGESLSTVSSTSADVKPAGKETTKKKRKAKKRGKAQAKVEAKKAKVVKPVKAEPERRGPMLRIKGSKESPFSVSILNGPRAEEDEAGSSRARQPAAPREFRRCARSRQGLFSSTLSARYDARTPDPTWVCVFCKLGPHKHGLGDLFGPYVVVRQDTDECEFSGDEKDIVDAQRRGGRHNTSIRAKGLMDYYHNMSRNAKRTKSTEAAEQAMRGLTPISDDESDAPRFEVWTHEACVVWSPGVCMIESRLHGLQEAVWHCHSQVCSTCSLNGANLGCIHRNCPNRSHYSCAVDAGWHLPDDTFISTCQFHIQRS